jgi:AraC-like DNA-binding protein
MSSRLDCFHNWEALAAEAGYQPLGLAERCQVSERQLRRFFLERFGTTAQNWVSQLRLKKAVMLICSGHSVKLTAFELGFKQPSHFCRVFKRVYGMTPRTYILAHSTVPRNGFNRS